MSEVGQGTTNNWTSWGFLLFLGTKPCHNIIKSMLLKELELAVRWWNISSRNSSLKAVCDTHLVETVKGLLFFYSSRCCLHETAQSRCDEKRSSLPAYLWGTHISNKNCQIPAFPVLPFTNKGVTAEKRNTVYRHETTVVLHYRRNTTGVF